MPTLPPAATRPTRREQILSEAARLFAVHGFHGTPIDGIGAAVGVSGPALYRHFPSKEALLTEMLVGISEYLLTGGREIATSGGTARAQLAALVDFHTDFALRQPELITVHDRDLANLPADARRRVRGLQRTYVELWVDTLRRRRPGLDTARARVAAHAAFGLMNSTPRSAAQVAGDDAAPVLRAMALGALRAV